MQTLTGSPISGSPISGSFTWDRAEHLRLMHQLTRHVKSLWLMRTGVLLVATVVFAGAVLAAVAGGSRWFRVLLPWLMILAFWVYLFAYGTAHASARAFARRHGPADRFEVTLSDDGARTACKHSDVLVKWDGVRQGVETREFFLLYTTWQCAQYLPKRALGGPAEVQRARELILRHVALQDATAKG